MSGRRIAAMAALQPTNHPQVHPIHCRSGPAREERPGNAGIQTAHVIVNDHRRSAARSKLARHKSFYDHRAIQLVKWLLALTQLEVASPTTQEGVIGAMIDSKERASDPRKRHESVEKEVQGIDETRSLGC